MIHVIYLVVLVLVGLALRQYYITRGVEVALAALTIYLFRQGRSEAAVQEMYNRMATMLEDPTEVEGIKEFMRQARRGEVLE